MSGGCCVLWMAVPDCGVLVEWRLSAGEELVSVALGGLLCGGGGWRSSSGFFRWI